MEDPTSTESPFRKAMKGFASKITGLSPANTARARINAAAAERAKDEIHFVSPRTQRRDHAAHQARQKKKGIRAYKRAERQKRIVAETAEAMGRVAADPYPESPAMQANVRRALERFAASER